MSGVSFSLQPFPTADAMPRLKIVGSMARRSNTLAVRYQLIGCLGEFVIPAPAETPSRKHGLWEETCFEFFLAVKSSPRYWEFNLSPAGCWNVYRFSAYREGMEEEPVLVSLPFSVESHPDSLSLALEVDLDGIVRGDQALEAGVSAVIKRKDGEVTCWALIHGGQQADFHRRESFIVEL